MRDHGSFQVFADYFQFYLWDKEKRPIAPVDYTDEDIKRRVKTAPYIVVIQTARNMSVPFQIEIYETAPGFEANDWDHIAECSLDVPSGCLQIHESTGGPIADFTVTPSCFRIRAFFGKLGGVSDNGLDGNDHYKVTMWPAEYLEVHVVKQWEG
ncbi:hypothetical protein CA54_51240 [Symmachiella macrocystis]|uniref:Uncharacterized protein n=1 Tax=Symmachiella macrocystis TaxID=2527985 RepID=A0A5C6B335_9PLAN|nr:hypothetical protein [Symmachiella macrocystis]TWU06725.1 hypothetical protein CA54_51240 [Symmachiella macrocystis]